MAFIWVICGAGRGVGKTHLANGLCKVLPEVVYAKKGHGERKTDRAKNYFATDEELDEFVRSSVVDHKHVVVECNSWAREGKGDIIVYLDGKEVCSNVRDDAELLRRNAHIEVSGGSGVREWKRILRDKVVDKSICESVCDLLVAQKWFVGGGRPAVRVKIWFDEGGVHVFGAGLARLLRYIDECGTLREAAESAGMSYRHAWGLIKNSEKHSGTALVVPRPGGVGGGRSSLSEHGRFLLGRYESICKEVAALAESCFDYRSGEIHGEVADQVAVDEVVGDEVAGDVSREASDEDSANA